jgi:hypothetical protein
MNLQRCCDGQACSGARLVVAGRAAPAVRRGPCTLRQFRDGPAPGADDVLRWRLDRTCAVASTMKQNSCKPDVIVRFAVQTPDGACLCMGMGTQPFQLQGDEMIRG